MAENDFVHFIRFNQFKTGFVNFNGIIKLTVYVLNRGTGSGRIHFTNNANVDEKKREGYFISELLEFVLIHADHWL